MIELLFALLWPASGIVVFGWVNAYFRRRFMWANLQRGWPCTSVWVKAFFHCFSGPLGLGALFVTGTRYGWSLNLLYPSEKEIAEWSVYGGKLGD